MINSYNLSGSVYNFLDASANLIDVFYLPDSYLSTPAIGGNAGVLISEDDGKHTRFISNSELLSMGFATVVLFTTQFNTDKGTVAGADTNMMNASLSGSASRTHTTNSSWELEHTGTFARIGHDNAGIYLDAYDGPKVLIGDVEGNENGILITVDDSALSIIINADLTILGSTSNGIVLDKGIGSGYFAGENFRFKSLDEGGTASHSLENYEIIDSTLGTGTTAVINVNVPQNSKIVAVQINNDVAITTSGGNNTYNAAFSGGSTTAISTGILGALNTKTNIHFAGDITTASTGITLTAGNAENFAGGTVQIVVWFWSLFSIGDA